MKCPDCRRILADVATTCFCGWHAAPVGQRPKCQRCDGEARMRIRKDIGWEDVCETHYVEHFKEQAAQSCEAWGLKRRPDESLLAYRARVSRWIREKAERLARKMDAQNAARD